MSLQNELKALFYFIPRFFKDLWEHEKNFARQYAHGIALAFLLIGVGVVGFFGYRWYAVSREQRTQLVLAEHIEALQRITAGSSEAMAAQLAQLESALSFDYQAHKGSAIAPLFLVTRADVQIRQGKNSEAIATLQEVLNALPSDSPLQNVVKTNRALLQLDSDQGDVQQVGLQELSALAHDAGNVHSDLALFYLGRFYWAHDKIEDAKAAWQELIDTPAYTQSFPSPWAYEAQQAIAQISQ